MNLNLKVTTEVNLIVDPMMKILMNHKVLVLKFKLEDLETLKERNNLREEP
jgi:hypothetical protein